MTQATKQPKDDHWLTRPSTIRLLWLWGIIILALTVLADLLITPHPYFGIDGSFGFYAWFGLLTCTAMVLFAKVLGFLLTRSDTYYREDNDND